MGLLENMDKEAIKKQEEFIHKHHTASGKSTHNPPQYQVSGTRSYFSLGQKLTGYAEREALDPGQDRQDACHLLSVLGMVAKKLGSLADFRSCLSGFEDRPSFSR